MINTNRKETVPEGREKVMTRISEVSQIFIAIALATCMGSTGCNSNRSTTETKQTTPSAQPQAQQQNTSVSRQRQDAESQVRPEVEKQRNEQNRQAQSTLDRDAIAAIDQTRNAINAIGAGKSQQALSDIESATGKITFSWLAIRRRRSSRYKSRSM
jgi:molecular chaperone GrpE (heat shock protein)